MIGSEKSTEHRRRNEKKEKVSLLNELKNLPIRGKLEVCNWGLENLWLKKFLKKSVT